MQFFKQLQQKRAWDRK